MKRSLSKFFGGAPNNQKLLEADVPGLVQALAEQLDIEKKLQRIDDDDFAILERAFRHIEAELKRRGVL